MNLLTNPNSVSRRLVKSFLPFDTHHRLASAAKATPTAMLLAPLPISRKLYDDVELLIQEQGVEG